MSELNQNARNLIEYYCSMEIPPEYALLVKGSWGCGKSHLVRDVITRMKKANAELKFLSVSLYGINDIVDIEAKFFEQLNPVLASKKMMFAGQIAKGVLKGALKIDLDGDGKADASANVSVPEINLAKYLTDTKNCILVFDDLERCSIDIQVILGYINYFVEKDGYKVVLIADEAKLIELSSVSDQPNIKYQSIKEKLVGKTVEVEADVAKIYDYFVEELISDRPLQDIILKHKKAVIKSFNESGYKNLRSLRKCFLDLVLWVELLDEEVTDKSDLIEHFLTVFTSVSMEVHAGKVLPGKVGELFGVGIDYLGMSDSELLSEEKKFTDIKSKYSLSFLDSVIDIGIFKQFFESGYINAQQVNISFKESRYFTIENTPDWKKLWYFLDLADEEFTSLQASVLESFNRREFTNLCELKHVVGLFLMHSKNDLLDKTPQCLASELENYLTDLEQNNSVQLSDDLLEELNGYGSYQGLGYTCREDAEFKEMSNSINDFIGRIQASLTRQHSINLIQIMQSDPKEFLELFNWSNERINYANVPILQFTPLEGFFGSFLSLPNDIKRRFMNLVKERLYHKDTVVHKLNPEFEWIKSFVKKLEDHLQGASASISKVVIGYGVKELNERIRSIEATLAQIADNKVC